jgi:hypothetical protein
VAGREAENAPATAQWESQSIPAGSCALAPKRARCKVVSPGESLGRYHRHACTRCLLLRSQRWVKREAGGWGLHMRSCARPDDSGAAPATVSEERATTQPLGPHMPGKASRASGLFRKEEPGTREPGYRPDARVAEVAEGGVWRERVHGEGGVAPAPAQPAFAASARCPPGPHGVCGWSALQCIWLSPGWPGRRAVPLFLLSLPCWPRPG